MIPKDIASLLEYLRATRAIDQLMASPLSAWGPASSPWMSADFLPPRPLEQNQQTIEEVRYRTVAAVDGTRHAPAQLVDGGELFGKVHFELGNSNVLRQITGPDYDGIVAYFNRNMGMEAARKMVGMVDSFALMAMTAHDEIANWQAIVNNGVLRRGDNGYVEYIDGPDLTGHRVAASDDWTDPAFDPWAEDIIPAIRVLIGLGYAREGIRVVTTDAVMQILADNPATSRRLLTGPLATGQTVQEAMGALSPSDVETVFKRKERIQSVQVNDQIVMTKTGQLRTFPQGHMTFIASTGRSEEVIFGENPEDVRVVMNTLGYTGIGVANGQSSPGRRAVVRGYTNQADARLEIEGWQTTGPVILDPDAIVDISGITS